MLIASSQTAVSSARVVGATYGAVLMSQLAPAMISGPAAEQTADRNTQMCCGYMSGAQRHCFLTQAHVQQVYWQQMRPLVPIAKATMAR